MSEATEKKVVGIFQRLKDDKLLAIAVIVFALSVTGVVLYLLFGRRKKQEAKKE